jgi:hypothetical protein
MNLKRNNYNIGGAVKILWENNWIPGIITSVTTVLMAPGEIVYTIEPLQTITKPSLLRRGNTKINELSATEDGRISISGDTIDFVKPGTVQFEGPTNTDLEMVIKELYFYMPSKEWDRAMPENLRRAKKIAESIVNAQTPHQQ